MKYGGEEKAIEKIERLKSYLSDGLPRYQDVLEQQGKEIPIAPNGIEYKDPGIMESQIFTVLSKRFKSGRLSFSKIGATCLAKICAIKVQENTIDIEKLKKEVPIDNGMEEYMNKIREGIKKVRKSLIVKKADLVDKNRTTCNSLNIDKKSPIFQEISLTPISELDYIF